MKTWNQLFIRNGWVTKARQGNVLDCQGETDKNLDFLFQMLKELNIHFTFEKGLLYLPHTVVSEEQWMTALDFEYRGRGGDLWFRPGLEEPKIAELDTYISGIVRQLNRLGFYTAGSCDGHGRRPANVMITKEKDMESLMGLFKALGVKEIRCLEQRSYYQLSFHMPRYDLLELAEMLNDVEEDWLDNGPDFIKEQLFQQMLEKLLNIPGESGNEEQVRNFVIENLTPYVDHITVDDMGNILAEKTYRGGNGPVVLLNAHLDTVVEIEDGRTIIKEGNYWYSNKGILGADDRAGVAVLLHLAKFLNQDSSFSGKVKFIFTVEEECGLVGASHVKDYFLWGTDVAIVVDRRGSGDIVTSCGGYLPFCQSLYGQFFEDVAVMEGLDGWKTTVGGSSDTRIWAEHGIQSVNLSAGYMHEHTDREELDVTACFGTVKLLEAVFSKGRELRGLLRKIDRKKNTMIG